MQSNLNNLNGSLMKIIVIIPARGGSKGIPNKNLRVLNDKPLIAHSIISASNSKLVNKIIVSTDSQRIAKQAKVYGAEPIIRPNKISKDTTQSEDALIHSLDYLKKNDNYEPDLVVFLQPTSPLRTHKDIDEAIEKLIDTKADSLFSASVEHFCGRWRMNKEKILKPQNYQINERPMRQAYPIEYIENGSIYIFRTKVIRKHNTRLGGKIEVFVMPVHRSIQIDSEEDMSLCEELISTQKREVYRRIKNVKLIVFDFDGVMTDNNVYVDQSGNEMVKCNRSDGLGISELIKSKYDVIVLSTEKNPVVKARCQKLGIECYQGCDNKIEKLKSIAKNRNILAKNIVFVGNDTNDIECMEWVKYPIAVSNSHPKIIETALMVTSEQGGSGAVREVADWIISSKNNTI